MKFWAYIACTILVAIIWQKPGAVAGNEVNMEEIRRECQAELGIPDSDIELLENFSAKEESIDKAKLRCFTYCFINKMGYLDDNDKLDVEKIEKDSQVRGIDIDKISDCKAMHDMTDDPCEYSFNMLMCVMS